MWFTAVLSGVRRAVAVALVVVTGTLATAGSVAALETFATGMVLPAQILPTTGAFPADSYLVLDTNAQRIWTVPVTGGAVVPFSPPPGSEITRLNTGPNDGVYLPASWGANAGKLFASGINLDLQILMVRNGIVSADGSFASFPTSLPSRTNFPSVLLRPDGNLTVTTDRLGTVHTLAPDGTATQLVNLKLALGQNFDSFGLAIAPAGFGSVGGKLLVSATTSGVIAAVDSAGAVTQFVEIPLAAGQTGLRHMLFSPPGFIPGAGSLLFVSVSGSRAGGGTRGDVVALDSSGEIVLSLRSLGLTSFDPRALFFVGDDTLLVGDSSNGTIVKVTSADFDRRIITTIAGNGSVCDPETDPTFPTCGDGGPATSASLSFPSALAVDGAGNVFFADRNAHKVRRIDGATGVVTTFAGTGEPGYNGDGIPAIEAKLNGPAGLAIDTAGNLYIADSDNHLVRRVGLDGAITTVAGVTASIGPGVAVDGPAIGVRLFDPKGLATVTLGGVVHLYIADTTNQQVRRVMAPGAPGSTLVAVAGTSGATGAQDGPALAATFNTPQALAIVVGESGVEVYVADAGNDAIRRISGEAVSTVAAGPLDTPSGIAADAAGDLIIADRNNHRLRKVSGADVTTVAGDGTPCALPTNPCGDGGPPTAARLTFPVAVAIDAVGDIYLADIGRDDPDTEIRHNQRIRKISAAPVIP
jgi:hypothetical protein